MPLDIDQFDAVLLDLDGTVYFEEDALPGAIEAIRKLQHRKKLFACLTNSTTGPQHLAARLSRMGLNVSPDNIYTAAAATRDYVLERFASNGKPNVYNLSTEGMEDLLNGRVNWVHREDEPCDVVISGVVVNVYATDERQRTALMLLRQGAALVSICADRVYPSPRGIEFGGGAMAAMLSYAANVQPTFCGKPEKIFFLELCQRLKVPPNRCVLVGDNLESDIAGGKGVGMATILTLTGITTRQHANCAAHKPDAIIPDLSHLL